MYNSSEVTSEKEPYKKSKMKCNNCNRERPTKTWVGEGSALDYIHGFHTQWCQVCIVETQIKYAEERRDALPELYKELQDAKVEAIKHDLTVKLKSNEEE